MKDLRATARAWLPVLAVLASAGPAAEATDPGVDLPSGLHLAGRGRPYRMTVASGGTAPYFLDVLDGRLPRGVDLDSDTNTLHGTPTTAGRYDLRMWANDATGSGTEDRLELLVAPPLPRRDAHTLAGGALHARYLELVAGTRLDLRLGVAGADPRRRGSAQLLRHDDAPVAGAEGLSGGPGTRRGTTVIEETGRYFLLLVPDGRFMGSIRLHARARAQRRWSGAGTAGGPGAAHHVLLALPEGARGTLLVRSLRGDEKPPVVRRVRLADGSDLDLTRKSRSGDGRVTVHLPRSAAAGDVRIEIESPDGLSMPLEWTARLRTPRRYRARLPHLAGGR